MMIKPNKTVLFVCIVALMIVMYTGYRSHLKPPLTKFNKSRLANQKVQSGKSEEELHNEEIVRKMDFSDLTTPKWQRGLHEHLHHAIRSSYKQRADAGVAAAEADGRRTRHRRIKRQTDEYHPRNDDPDESAFRVDPESTDISKLRVYVYPLTREFNVDLASCAARPTNNDMCFDFANDGFGRAVDGADAAAAVHRTHQFSAEIVFHRKLLRSRYATNDPRDADLFYVPYYASLNCFCSYPTDASLDDRFWKSLVKSPFLNAGKPHFMALGKIEQEMSQSKTCSFLMRDDTHRMKYLVIERTHSQTARQSFNRTGKQNETIVVPYPSFIHLHRPNSTIFNTTTQQQSGSSTSRSSGSRRDIFALFAGSEKNNLRKILGSQLQSAKQNHGSDYASVYHPMPQFECQVQAENSASVVTGLMRRSKFCLQPPGDSPTRKSFYDSLLSGCIPVVFESGVKYPFDDVLNYAGFTVFVDGSSITRRREDVVATLKNIPESRVRRLQTNAQRVARYLQYGLYDDSRGDDAVTMALRELTRIYKIQPGSNTRGA
ncbi:uncharacterized protein LOC141902800 [Tubulanus polymorphus]|uniref:uncharacterized protein LOC141902800 n=1 Tax=Tubulanus polymorphus TaxID=672921 RepID=UPI003DA382E6